MILKKIFDRIHHHHHHHNHNSHNHHHNHSHYDSLNLDMGNQTSTLVSSENEPLTPPLHSQNRTNSLMNSNHRISSIPNFIDDSDQTPTPRRPSIGNETRTPSSDCLHLHASKKNKQSSSSIYNEAENENCPHFYASSNSSQSDCAKVISTKRKKKQFHII